MNDYLIGNLVGLTQTSIGYPFDTIKTNLVNGYTGKIHFSKLLRGIKYPLVGSCMNNNLVFANYHHFYDFYFFLFLLINLFSFPSPATSLSSSPHASCALPTC